MVKFAAFDIEIAKVLPETCPECGKVCHEGRLAGVPDHCHVACSCGYRDQASAFKSQDWEAHRPLGISCAAVATPGAPDPWWYWSWTNRASTNTPATIVKYLQMLVGSEYTLVTWNGGAFDFDILAEESGMRAECAELARQHIDLMAIVVALRGHYLGLDTAAKGMAIEGKRKVVTLHDGTTMDGMNGALAPVLWQQGEYDAVLDYLREDVRVTLALAYEIADRGFVSWTARSGRRNTIRIPELLTVDQCLERWRDCPPDNGWMTDPPDLEQMLAWMGQ